MYAFSFEIPPAVPNTVPKRPENKLPAANLIPPASTDVILIEVFESFTFSFPVSILQMVACPIIEPALPESHHLVLLASIAEFGL